MITIPFDGNVWLTSDLHFYHEKVIEYCNRPTTPENQTDWLIGQLNSKIGKNDTVIHLGDFMFGRANRLEKIKNIMRRLNGTWYFIMGNHDTARDFIELSQTTKHKFIGSYYEHRYVDKERDINLKLNFMHFPIESWNQMRYGSLMLHGHTHGQSTKRVNRFDCGIDAHPNHEPFDLKTLIGQVDYEFYKEDY